MGDQRIDFKMALNAEIVAQGHSDDQLNRNVPAVAAKSRRVANTSVTEWNVGSSSGPGGAFQEHWPEHLPRPPSMKKLNVDETSAKGNPNLPRVIVFNANTQEGSSMVRVLSEKGMNVVAVVRVFTSRNTKNLINLKNVTVKVADLNNKEAVVQSAEGCQQAFLVTKYWERFESPIEEHNAQVVLAASAEVGIKRIILATFEDTRELRLRNRKSQLMPTRDGRIFPSFEGMDAIDAMGKNMGVQITHMFTSYLDDADSKKSLILIRGENGKIISQPYIQDLKK
jgi:NmrA-like family